MTTMMILKSLLVVAFFIASTIIGPATAQRHVLRSRVNRMNEKRGSARMGLRFDLPQRSLQNGSVSCDSGKGGKGKGGGSSGRRRKLCNDYDSVETGAEPATGGSTPPPVEPTSAPLDPTSAPVDPTSAPVDPVPDDGSGPDDGPDPDDGSGPDIGPDPDVGPDPDDGPGPDVGPDPDDSPVPDDGEQPVDGEDPVDGGDADPVDGGDGGGPVGQEPDPSEPAEGNEEGGDPDDNGDVPSNDLEPTAEIPPSNDIDADGQEGNPLGADLEVPEIEIVIESPGITLHLDETLDNLGGGDAEGPPPHVPSNDDP